MPYGSESVSLTFSALLHNNPLTADRLPEVFLHNLMKTADAIQAPDLFSAFLDIYKGCQYQTNRVSHIISVIVNHELLSRHGILCGVYHACFH